VAAAKDGCGPAGEAITADEDEGVVSELTADLPDDIIYLVF
jgi:hypothetical protein